MSPGNRRRGSPGALRIVLASCRDLPAWEVDDKPLVEALRRRGAGVETIAWDDGDLDPENRDAILLRTTWDYVPRVTEFLAWTERAGRLTSLFNPSSLVRWNSDKTYLRDLEGAGVPVVPTVWLEGAALERARTAGGLAEILGDGKCRRAFLKPIVGASAVGALPFDVDPSGFERAARHLRDFPAPRGFLLQPYLSTVESRGEISAIFIDGEYSHGVRKIPLPGDFRVQDDYGASDRREDWSETTRQVARHAVLAAARHTGSDLPPLYARADFLEDPDRGPLLVELELIEPSLFFRHAPEAAERLAECLLRRLA